jgi:hypothetical protein
MTVAAAEVNAIAASSWSSRVHLAITGRTVGCALLAVAISLALYFPERMLSGSFWIWLGLVDLALMYHLVRMYLHTGLVLCALFFSFTYFLSPIPYFLFEIPIVPYAASVSIVDFVRTWLVMSAFLAWLAMFSSLTASAERAVPEAFGPRIREQGIGVLGTFFWLAVIPLMVLSFKGAAIVNVSGADNWGDYLENLQTQNGTIEYFLIVVVIGRVISRTLFQKLCYALCVGYHLYFCFTRGYRVAMLEMLVLVTALHFPDRLSLRNVLVASFTGFLAFQALGFMKTGASDLSSLFTVMVGDEIRSNQTEVFYTSDVVIHAVFSGWIPISVRLQSLFVAMLATFLPGSVLPETWQTTVSTLSVVPIEAGGGGFIAGHYYYWGGVVGLMVSGLVITGLFRFYERAQGQRAVLLATLIMSTFPRWVAYEPVAMFFRLGLYFVVLYELIYQLRRVPLPVMDPAGR